ncbi:unnamed protein product [Triticum turgidum subsp. durum]|uniref:Uncharacterized protein n=1 Tax=Triticum turgidum subsp. durum TaxID=4567 RepID=A0A9R1A354_TRITD|nr:unnamed protein product [Triticum turgidum subsp. durum]
MRSGLARVGRWSWARPDARTYALLVQRLAAALRVSDAIRIVDYVSRAGVSSAEEVPFGITVRCPTCMVAIAVAQPQHGTQVRCCRSTCFTSPSHTEYYSLAFKTRTSKQFSAAGYIMRRETNVTWKNKTETMGWVAFIF